MLQIRVSWLGFEALLWFESLAELTLFYQHHVLFSKYTDDDLVF